MKNIIKGLFSAIVLVSGLSACENTDYPDRFKSASGVPTIDYIRYADRDVFIDQAYMDETICIVGSNLKSVKELWFNDQPAILNTSFMTEKTLVVNVPKNPAKETTDKIYFITRDKDTVATNFHVMPPMPIASAMSCEYAAPGSEVTIYGDYFIDLEYVEFQGSDARVEAKDLKYTPETITLKIPQGATPGMVKVKTNSGLAGSLFHYMDQRGLLFDFDGKTGLGNHGWHAMPIENDGTGISGNYVRLGDGTTELEGDGTDWNDSVFSFEYWPGNWKEPEDYSDPEGRRLLDLVDFSSWSSMGIKFELCIPAENPWKGTPLQVVFAGVNYVTTGAAGTSDIYGNILGGANNDYFHNATYNIPRALYEPWKATGSFDTGGKWITVTLTFANDFVWFWDGTKSSGNLDSNSFASLLFMMAAGDGTGAPSAPILKIDNIRAVPVK